METADEEEDWRNPLLLNVILDNVFENLRLKDLLTCRAVCKTWCCNTQLRNAIKNKSKVCIRAIFLRSSATSENIEDYFRVGGPIYENYHFENISFGHTLVSKLFQVLGPTIKSIILRLNLHQLNSEQFRELIYDRLPNLEELYIYGLSDETVFKPKLFPPGCEPPQHVNLKRLQFQEVRTSIAEFLTDFMKTTPNLESIILKTEICGDWEDQADMWRSNSMIAWSVLKSLNESGAYKSLKEFRCGKLRKKMVEQLLLMGINGLHLEAFEMHAPPKDYEEAITAFLKMQKDSLKELVLFEQRSYQHGVSPGNPDETFMLRLPDVMPKLEVLRFSKFQKAVMVPMQYTDYSKQCPKLKKLIFLGFDYGESPYGNLYVPQKPHKNMDELVLWAMCDETRLKRPGISEAIGRSFPYLTHLTIFHPNSAFLKALWGHCENLTKLVVTFHEEGYMDEAITGIPESQIERWLSHPDNFRVTEPSDPKQSITNLKKLRILEMVVDFNDSDERQSLCDATAYFALGSMKHLRYLTLFSSDWQTGLTSCLFFSKTCETQLRQVLNTTVIHFVPPPDDE